MATGCAAFLARNTVHTGDVREMAARLEPRSVQTIVTSPPYFGLRSYLDADHPSKARELGGEETPAAFVANLVAVFAALRPALKDDGTIWLNLGDSYSTHANGNTKPRAEQGNGAGRFHLPAEHNLSARAKVAKVGGSYPEKCLYGMPWRVAFALIDDGWILRSDVIWAKPAPMPESVTDRPTRSHEYLFLLSKKPNYFYDATAIAENVSGELRAASWAERKAAGAWAGNVGVSATYQNGVHGAGVTHDLGGHGGKRNKRSVWTITSAQFPDAHYATFPPDLVRPCVLAGTSAAGECVACGKAWVRCVEREGETPRQKQQARGMSKYANGQPYNPQGLDYAGGHGSNARISRDLGWAPQCQCPPGTPTRPQVVLDPFGGSGTTASVAHELGRDWLLTDLDERAVGWTNARLAKMPVARLAGC